MDQEIERTPLKRQEITATVREELEHIPEIKGNRAQDMLRWAYNGYRRYALRVDPLSPPHNSLQLAIARVKRDYPEAPLRYHNSFFTLPEDR